MFTLEGTTVAGELVKLWVHECEDWADKDAQIYLFKSSD